MKRVLVFGGGGSKGAYEIGVWKALDELGLHFDAVCGTSIGALIGTMLCSRITISLLNYGRRLM